MRALAIVYERDAGPGRLGAGGRARRRPARLVGGDGGGRAPAGAGALRRGDGLRRLHPRRPGAGLRLAGRAEGADRRAAGARDAADRGLPRLAVPRRGRRGAAAAAGATRDRLVRGGADPGGDRGPGDRGIAAALHAPSSGTATPLPSRPGRSRWRATMPAFRPSGSASRPGASSSTPRSPSPTPSPGSATSPRPRTPPGWGSTPPSSPVQTRAAMPAWNRLGRRLCAGFLAFARSRAPR